MAQFGRRQDLIVMHSRPRRSRAPSPSCHAVGFSSSACRSFLRADAPLAAHPTTESPGNAPGLFFCDRDRANGTRRDSGDHRVIRRHRPFLESPRAVGPSAGPGSCKALICKAVSLSSTHPTKTAKTPAPASASSPPSAPPPARPNIPRAAGIPPDIVPPRSRARRRGRARSGPGW